MSPPTVGLLSNVLEAFVNQVRGSALETHSAETVRPVWVEPVNHCSPLTLLAVVIGATWILSALFTKNARTLHVSDAKLENA